MTAVATPATTRTAPPRPAPRAAVRLLWSWRLVRRSAALTWLGVAAYMGIEVLVFRQAYPDAESRRTLLQLTRSGAVRMMQGEPGAVDTAGGFAVWDAGWMLMIITACWALLTALRLTRGEEDAGRSELVLARPLTPRAALAAHLTACGLGAAGIGVFAALPLVVLGESAGGALIWGAGLASLAAVVAALGVLVAQLLEPRRRAVSLGLGLVSAAFLVRLAGNSADARAWMQRLTPFGWVQELRPYSAQRWAWLAPSLAAAGVLAAAALVLSARRDSGAALVHGSARARSHLRLLGGPVRFGWRLTSGVLLGWTLTLAVSTFVFGLMTSAVIDFIESDATYRRMLEAMGVDLSVPAVGYCSYIGVFLALPLAAFTGWRIGAARQEEAAGRLDNLLVRGVVRWRWLAATSASAGLASLVLVLTTALGVWSGAAAVGAPVTAWQVIEPIVGTFPLVVLFLGIAVLTFGVASQFTVVVPVVLALLGYLLETFGSALGWPGAVLGVSPFHHLARLPGAPMTWTAVVTMLGLGVAACALGCAAFARRDLRGE